MAEQGRSVRRYDATQAGTDRAVRKGVLAQPYGRAEQESKELYKEQGQGVRFINYYLLFAAFGGKGE